MSKFIKIYDQKDNSKEKLINVSIIDTITKLNDSILETFNVPKDEQSLYFALEIKTKDETYYGTIRKQNWFKFESSI